MIPPKRPRGLRSITEGTSVASTPGGLTLVEHALWKSAPSLRKGGASVSTGDPSRVDLLRLSPPGVLRTPRLLSVDAFSVLVVRLRIIRLDYAHVGRTLKAAGQLRTVRRLFFFMIISIFSVWIGFADVIKPDLHYVDRCIKISNPHWIPWYKLIVRYYELSLGQTSYGVYEVKENKCLWLSPRTERAEEILFLIDENIDLSTLDNLPLYDFHRKLWKNFIRLDDINLNLWYVSDPNLIKNEIITYKLVGNWNFLKIERIDDEEWEKEIEDEKNYTLEIVETEQWIELASEDRLIKFWIAWIITIFIETIVLFIIAKLFRKNICEKAFLQKELIKN